MISNMFSYTPLLWVRSAPSDSEESYPKMKRWRPTIFIRTKAATTTSNYLHKRYLLAIWHSLSSCKNFISNSAVNRKAIISSWIRKLKNCLHFQFWVRLELSVYTNFIKIRKNYQLIRKSQLHIGPYAALELLCE